MLALYLNDINEQQNKEKFEDIYLTYEQKMFTVAYGILRHKENAEDAVHDAFEVIIRKLDVIEDVHSQKAWNYIMVIVKNKAIRIYNKVKNKKETMSDDYNLLMDMMQDELSDVEAKVEEDDIVEILAHMILELPDRCRDVLYLHYYNELSYADVAQVLEMTEENARQIARRSRKMLAEKLTARGISYE